MTDHAKSRVHFHPLLLAIAFSGAVVTLPSCSPKATEDSRFAAIYTAEWTWRQEQFPDNEDSRRPVQDHLPKVAPESQQVRLKMWQDTLAKLDSIRREELSPAERVNYDVYRPQIETLIANQRFRDYEMPANSDTTFWTDLGYTARRPYRDAQDYRNWIAQMSDIPRYFREQIEEMRRGLKRGFTPPRVTLEGRDASITAVTEADPEQCLFYTPFKEMPGIGDAQQASLRTQAIDGDPRFGAAGIPGTAGVHAGGLSAGNPDQPRGP